MPITPVFEQPPVARHSRQLDWTEQLDALVAHPGEWAKVDGPFTNTGSMSARAKSLRSFAEQAEVRVETRTAKVGEASWLYARTVAKAAPTPVAAVPPPSPIHDDGTHTHQCDTCGDSFRTNARLRQHQANAHKAS